MYEYRPILLLIIIELSLFFFIWGLLFQQRIHFFFRDRKQKKARESIAHFFTERLKGQKEPYPKAFRERRLLLEQLERFDQKFTHTEWYQIKEEVIQKFLLQRARRYAKSFFWKKRLFAARCFVLLPDLKDEKALCLLVNDSYSKVKLCAARALISLESACGIRRVLESVSTSSGYVYYMLCDILQKSSQNVLKMLVKDASEPLLQKACLKVLATQVVTVPIPFLQKYLDSSDREDKLLAIEVLSHNPTQDAEKILLKFLEDPSVQKRAIQGLGRVGAEEGIKRLQAILAKEEDQIIQVEAAKALQALGKLDLIRDTEIKEYVLRFG